MPSFDALGIVVSDMAAALAFYRLLGLKFPAGAEGGATSRRRRRAVSD